MKNFFLLLLSTGFVIQSFAQQNAFKLNLAGFVVKNISVQYERQIGEKTSVALGFRDIPYGKVPFPNKIADLVGNPFVDYNKINVGSFAVTPEFRYYLGKNGAMRGFYIGPFVSYSSNKSDLPIAYAGKTGIFNGKITTFTGGVQIGAQFKLSNSFFLDWWIVGPNYGAESGNLIYTGSLTQNEQNALEFELKKLQTDIPFKFIDTYSVDANGATLNAKGPWAGLRGFGINLSYHF